jgi:hypothetical protein
MEVRRPAWASPFWRSSCPIAGRAETVGPHLGVQVDYNVVHLRTSLVQLFVLLLQNFEKLVQMIELKRFGGAPNGYPFAPLPSSSHDARTGCHSLLLEVAALYKVSVLHVTRKTKEHA